jgi:hypothetical protein
MFPLLSGMISQLLIDSRLCDPMCPNCKLKTSKTQNSRLKTQNPKLTGYSLLTSWISHGWLVRVNGRRGYVQKLHVIKAL